MLTLTPRAGPDRVELIETLRHRLATHGFPRLQMMFIVGVAGGAAFLGSVLMLRAGLESMPARYGLAALAGYVVFLGMIRLWIAWQRGHWEPDIDVVDAVDAANAFVPEIGVPSPRPMMFAGGSSGGGGATGVIDSGVAAPIERAASKSSGWSIDPGDSWPLIVAIACAGLAGIAIIYTVWIAPALLAEVALDAALVTALYRKLRKEEAGTWIGSAFRRTWMAGAAVVVLMTVAGYALAAVAPDAKSIGGVVSAWRARQAP